MNHTAAQLFSFLCVFVGVVLGSSSSTAFVLLPRHHQLHHHLAVGDSGGARTSSGRQKIVGTQAQTPTLLGVTANTKNLLSFNDNDYDKDNDFNVELENEELNRLLGRYSEQSRQDRRKLYNAADWVRARAAERFSESVSTTFQSGLIRQLSKELIFMAFVSTFVVVWNGLTTTGFDDLFGIGIGAAPLLAGFPTLELPLAPFTLSITALGLLLTFRTNASYSRWNEARTAWGKVINDSRSIMRMSCIWTTTSTSTRGATATSNSLYDGKDMTTNNNNRHNDTLLRLGEAVCLFSRVLMNRTLPSQEDEANFQVYLNENMTDQEYALVIRKAKHRPTAALAEISAILVDLDLNPIHHVEIERAVTGLCNALGVCERILTSPVPTIYTRHTARFLSLWLLSVPAGLWEPFGMTWNHWGTIPVTVLLSAFLLGIDELAAQMEEPFSILPMEKMCQSSIRTPVMEQVERSTTTK